MHVIIIIIIIIIIMLNRSTPTLIRWLSQSSTTIHSLHLSLHLMSLKINSVDSDPLAFCISGNTAVSCLLPRYIDVLLLQLSMLAYPSAHAAAHHHPNTIYTHSEHWHPQRNTTQTALDIEWFHLIVIIHSNLNSSMIVIWVTVFLLDWRIF